MTPFKQILSALLALAAMGCASVTIDEDFVFRPQTAFDEAKAGSTEPLKWEAAFSGVEPISIDIEAWSNQRASIRLPAGTLTPSKVSHGFIGANAPIAYTLIARDDHKRPLFVHCGGNTAARHDSGTPYGLKLIDFGDVLLFDYPGYGDTPGRASTQSLKAMNAVIAGLVNRLSGKGRPVILWGHSLGGFVCADMVAALGGVDGIVFEASARNAKKVARTVPPWFARPFVRFDIAHGIERFDNVDALDGVGAPILVLGAKKDRTLPVKLSRRLASDLTAQGHDVTYAEFPDANHISVATAETFPETVQGFVERIKAER